MSNENKKQQMKNALKNFGIKYEYDENVINATIENDYIIQNLINEFESNHYNISYFDMNDFLITLNDIESNGVCENFEIFE